MQHPPNAPGTLYVVSTPIGNLEDVSMRAKRLLGEADVVVAEDTRHTGRLMVHLGTKRPMISLHDKNESRRVPGLVQRLLDGENLALVSDAGTPLVSDPGYPLVRAAIEAGADVVPIPGPSALLAALVGSGLPMDRFLFAGFPPRTSGKRKRWMENMTSEKGTLVLYESPMRLARTCGELALALGDRKAVIARELTKRFEEFVRASLTELAERYATTPPRGEVVLVVAGNRKK